MTPLEAGFYILGSFLLGLIIGALLTFFRMAETMVSEEDVQENFEKRFLYCHKCEKTVGKPSTGAECKHAVIPGQTFEIRNHA